MAACADLKIDAATLDRHVQRWGLAQRFDDLKLGGYHRLVDFFLLEGFRTRHRQVLTVDTLGLVEKAYADLGLSRHVLEVDLRRQGIRDMRDMDGCNLLDLMAAMEVRGVDLARFKAARRSVQPRQLKILGAARKATEISDVSYYRLIQRYGGVNTGADLDARGFHLTMLCLEDLGFRQLGLHVDPNLADRPGFATPRQVALIQALWTEWTGDACEGPLNAWLERYYRVSALRFLTAQNASKAITALKAMKARTAS